MPSARSLAALAASLLTLAALPPAAQAGGAERPPAEQVALRGSPISVDGLWCGVGLLHSYSLDIAQRAHLVAAKLKRRNRVHEITGRIEGSTLRTDPQRNETLELRAQDDALLVTGGTGILSLLKGQSFTRAAGGSCTH
jgi:hypothetical protein